MKSLGKELGIILIFALLHAAITIIARWQGLSDHLMLTTLTMLMGVSLCQIRRTNVATMIIILIIVNFGGFYLSKWIGRFIHLFIANTYIRGGIATFSTTFIIGLTVCGIVSWIKKIWPERKQAELSTFWLLLVFTVIIVARLALIFITDGDLYKGNITMNVIIDYTFCSVALCFLGMNAVKETRKAQEAKESSNIARYSYIRLQQQVKPHFMFNNLNILNSLICENQNQEASAFIYKLAYLYRYMIENEEESLVTIREEMDFANKYADLMKVRFESSLNITNEIDEDTMSNLVVPCSIQLLVENAIKHNGGTNQTPLNIRIYSTNSQIVVWNNRIPKNSCEPSTRLGLKYIRQRYNDICSKNVDVESNDEEFIVKLPIIR